MVQTDPLAAQPVRKPWYRWAAAKVRDGQVRKTAAEAQAIGHVKIDRFAPGTATAQRVRLAILSSIGLARIREFKPFVAES